ncbi:hypothetical protein BD310DRAFT_360520 [Dichomitus squalens]|uniref:Uncharacterized protein n=1 Tax=Dichomitus squalens TaxID=114155 RepID=A0A4Q9P9L4_9APHY|nr:hypothetical protein BD310DRAFT_360520 [Dichomitus squalens]
MKIKVETALSLYSLGLVCSVDTVEILDPGSFAYEESDRELDGVMPAVLADVRPRCLVVDIPSAESMTTLLAPLYGSSSVTRLTISFSLGMLMGIPLAYILERLRVILQNSAVSQLTIVATASAEEFVRSGAIPPSLRRLLLDVHFLGSLKAWQVGLGAPVDYVP